VPKDDSPVTSNPDWKTYRAGEGDRAARRIDRVYALGDDYIMKPQFPSQE